jgi:hypothetical protein
MWIRNPECPIIKIIINCKLAGHLQAAVNTGSMSGRLFPVDILLCLSPQMICQLSKRYASSGRSPATLISSYCPFKMILPDGTLSGHLETVGNPDGVDALVQQILGLLQQSAAQHHHASRPVSDLVVLKTKKCNNQPVVRDSDPGIRDGKQSGSGIRN